MDVLAIAKTLCSYKTDDLAADKWTVANGQAKNLLYNMSNDRDAAVDYLTADFSNTYTTDEDDDGKLIIISENADDYEVDDIIYIEGSLYNQMAKITAIDGNNITTNLNYTETAAVAASADLEIIADTVGAGQVRIIKDAVTYYANLTYPTSKENIATFLADLGNWDVDPSLFFTVSKTGEVLTFTEITAGARGNDSTIIGVDDITDPDSTETNFAGGSDVVTDTGVFYDYSYYMIMQAEAWLTIYALVKTAQQIVNNKILFSSQNFGEGQITQAGIETKKQYEKELLKKVKTYISIGGSSLV